MIKLGPEAVHLCIDMQTLFAANTEWHTPALAGIIPNCEKIVRHAPERTVFTRFMTPQTASEAKGRWQTYYRRWHSVLADRNPESLYDVVPELGGHAPPARIIDKFGHSAFDSPDCVPTLDGMRARTIILTGVETDVCVLASMLPAIDLGYYVVLVTDAVTSSSPAGHRSVLDHVVPRYDQQVDVIDTETLLRTWKP